MTLFWSSECCKYKNKCVCTRIYTHITGLFQGFACLDDCNWVLGMHSGIFSLCAGSPHYRSLIGIWIAFCFGIINKVRGQCQYLVCFPQRQDTVPIVLMCFGTCVLALCCCILPFVNFTTILNTEVGDCIHPLKSLCAIRGTESDILWSPRANYWKERKCSKIICTLCQLKPLEIDDLLGLRIGDSNQALFLPWDYIPLDRDQWLLAVRGGSIYNIILLYLQLFYNQIWLQSKCGCVLCEMCENETILREDPHLVREKWLISVNKKARTPIPSPIFLFFFPKLETLPFSAPPQLVSLSQARFLKFPDDRKEKPWISSLRKNLTNQERNQKCSKLTPS